MVIKSNNFIRFQLWKPLKLLDHKYSQTCNIIDTLVDNQIVDHSDVVGALPVGAAPTTSSYLT